MPKPKHRYQVNVYLGKETYEQIAVQADALCLPVATMTRIILETGLQFVKAVGEGAQTKGK